MYEYPLFHSEGCVQRKAAARGWQKLHIKGSSMRWGKLLMLLLDSQSSINLRRSVSNKVSRSDLFGKSLSGDGFSNHGSHDTHHSGTSLVDFHVKLVLELVSLQKVGDERTSVPGSVVSRVVGSRPDGKLANTAEEENLSQTGGGNREKSHHTIGDIRESDSHLLGKVSGELNSGIVEKHTDNGSHGNTSVLSLNSSATLEVGVESGELGGGVLSGVQPSKRIVKAQRSGNSNRGVKGVNALVQGGGSLPKTKKRTQQSSKVEVRRTARNTSKLLFRSS